MIKSKEKEDWQQMSALEKLHNIVVHTHTSSARFNELKKLVDQAISHDNDTR